jgi:hypothetical protein
MNWKPGIDSGDSLTTYYLRSWPKGRIGKTLEKGEVRLTSVYVADRCVNSIANLRIVLSFLVGHVDMDAYVEAPIRESYSVDCIPLLPLASFDEENASFDLDGAACSSNNTDPRMIFASTVMVVHPSTPTPKKSFRTGNHDYEVASVVVGVPVKYSARQCYELTTEPCYNNIQVALLSQLSSNIAKHRPEFTQRVVTIGSNPMAAAAFALNSSRIACDMLSAAGLVDIIASPVACGAVPDAMLHPLQLPLVLALLTRMAAKPEKYQLKAGTHNDAYAASELAGLVECQFHPILRYYDGEPLWAVDVCAIVALTQIKAQLLKVKKKKDRENQETNVDKSMNALFSLGTALCNDVVGCTISGDTYTDFGMAENMCGPIETARAKAATARGMGKLGTTLSSMRVSSRAARQRALVSMICEVEEFLRSGQCKSLQLAGSAGPRHKVGAVQDENGFLDIPSFEGCDVEATLTRATSREAFFQAREQLQKLLLFGPVVLNEFHLNTYVASNYSKVPCVECESKVDVFGAVVFSQMTSECSICHGKRCWKCATLAGSTRDVCKHCAQAAT